MVRLLVDRLDPDARAKGRWFYERLENFGYLVARDAEGVPRGWEFLP